MDDGVSDADSCILLEDILAQKEEQCMEKCNKNDDAWVPDYRFYPEQGYYITNKKKNEYR